MSCWHIQTSFPHLYLCCQPAQAVCIKQTFNPHSLHLGHPKPPCESLRLWKCPGLCPCCTALPNDAIDPMAPRTACKPMTEPSCLSTTSDVHISPRKASSSNRCTDTSNSRRQKVHFISFPTQPTKSKAK